MGTVSDDRGPEEIPVLVELEVQQWVDEALRNAARATERILDRIASLGVRRPDQDCGEASDFDLTDSKAAQAVMRAVTAYPLNDMQLERIVKLALGKRILEATTATADGGPPRAATSVVRTVDDPQTRPEATSDDGCESHRADSTEPEESPSANRTARPATPSAEGVAAERGSEASAAQQPIGDLPSATTTTPSSGKKRLGRLPERRRRPAAQYRPQVASGNLHRRSRGSVRCLAAREDTTPATA
jgi:hypothetical protein